MDMPSHCFERDDNGFTTNVDKPAAPACPVSVKCLIPARHCGLPIQAATWQHGTGLQEQYTDETFVHVLPAGQIPHTRHVRGSNFVYISVFPDRLPGRAIIISGSAAFINNARRMATLS